MKTKKNVHLFVIISFVLASCSSLEVENGGVCESVFSNPNQFVELETSPSTIVLQRMGRAGELHNEFLDSVVTKQISLSNLGSHLYNFSVQKSIIRDSLIDSISFVNGARKMCFHDNGTPLSEDYYTTQDSIIIPEKWNYYITRMSNMITSRIDTALFKRELTRLQDGIMQNAELDDVDKTALIGISAIAKASYNYHSSNIDYQQATTQQFVTFEKCVKADLLGAAGKVGWSLVTGALKNLLIFGPGGVVEKVAADVFVGGALSSGKKLIDLLF